MVRELLEAPKQKKEVELFIKALDVSAFENPHGGLNASSQEGNFFAPFSRDTLYYIFDLIDVYKNIPLKPLVDHVQKNIEFVSTLQATDDFPLEERQRGGLAHEWWKLDPDMHGKLEEFVKTGRYVRKDGKWSEMVYYGACDPPLLFVIDVDEFLRITEDEEFKQRIKPNIYLALEWDERKGDPYLFFPERKNGGIKFQAWRDSDDAIQDRNGEVLQGSVAEAGIQALRFQFFLHAAWLVKDTDPNLSDTLINKAIDLKNVFNKDFWIEDEGYFAEAIDEKGRQRGDIVSVPAEILWTGIVADDKAEKVIQRVKQEDLWTPFGIRTLSSTSPNFNQAKYHKGTIWPAPSNSQILKGLLEYGYKKEARELALNNLSAIYYFDNFKENWGYIEGEDKPVSLAQSNDNQLWVHGAILRFLSQVLTRNQINYLLLSLQTRLEKEEALVTA